SARDHPSPRPRSARPDWACGERRNHRRAGQRYNRRYRRRSRAAWRPVSPARPARAGPHLGEGHIMNARVLVLRDVNGAAVKSLDVSDLENADTAAPFALTVETQCDLGEWHQSQRTEFAPWGSR